MKYYRMYLAFMYLMSQVYPYTLQQKHLILSDSSKNTHIIKITHALIQIALHSSYCPHNSCNLHKSYYLHNSYNIYDSYDKVNFLEHTK